MTNKYYAAGAQRTARVQALFAAIASRYDLINDLQSFGMHRLWKRRVVRLATSGTGRRALDICCGTGDLTHAMARRGMAVIGLDFSEPMLAIAARRSHEQTARGRLAHPPQFLRGDAQRLPFPDSSFDAVTMGYGLRNLADWEVGLSEMRRVTRPGGRILVLDFGKPENALLRAAWFAYLRHCVPILGRIFCGDADTHAYILESLQHYAAQKGVAAKMAELQLVKTRIINLAGGIMSINYAEKAA